MRSKLSSYKMPHKTKVEETKHAPNYTLNMKGNLPIQV